MRQLVLKVFIHSTVGNELEESKLDVYDTELRPFFYCCVSWIRTESRIYKINNKITKKESQTSYKSTENTNAQQ